MKSRLMSRLGVLSVLGLLLSGCSDAEPGAGPAQSPALSPDEASQPAEGPDESPAELAEFYSQTLVWTHCADTSDEDMRCSSVEVPMDYEDPSGERIEIALITSSTREIPFLLTNPGGPGQSGVDAVAENLAGTVTAELLEEFNVVGFDPRGVHRSAPVTCMDDAEMDAYRQQVSDPDLNDDDAYAAAFAQAQQIAQQCADRTGDVLGHVDTFSAARDMDVLRSVLDQEQLHYVGFSYGTKLGLAYAELFPERVGRFVLDSVMDVSLDAQELAQTQTVGFEVALENFAQWCAGSQQCPIPGETEDVISGVQDLFSEVQQNPQNLTDGRILNASTLVSGFITPLYHPQGWIPLRDGLRVALEEADYYPFQYWADLQAGRNEDGTYDWINTWAFRAVMCLDYPTAQTQEEIEAEQERLNEAAPTFGPYMGNDGVLCSQWPHQPVNVPWEPGLEEVEELLLLATTGDPATPVQWAESVHEQLPQSSLLVSEGEGHIAYRPGNRCVTEIVDDYLLTGEIFDGRTTC